MMNMVTAISTCFRKYATYTGTASRGEYWYFFLLYVIAELILLRLGVLYLLVILLWIPLSAVGVRRMHDAGRSGWWLLVPLVNLVFLCAPTERLNNRYTLGSES